LGFEKTHFLTNKAHFVAGLAGSALVMAVAVVAHAPLPAIFLMLWLAVWSVGTLALLAGALGA
ncbi:MAG: hypothetical protein GTO31_15445, partial [Xanthomonadales bacterium]|nr:hypothetical protein [Xanthomonadales bacterium]